MWTLNTLEVRQMYGTHTLAFQGISSLLQSKFHLRNDSNCVIDVLQKDLSVGNEG
jgi:hypothetical protein